MIGDVLEGRDVLMVVPTGFGKSACYQIPSMILAKPVLVISPLLALMRDQQEKLRSRDVDCVRINGTVRGRARRDALDRVTAGGPLLVMTTPETLATSEMAEALNHVGVGLVAVDEAHCISEWGHDFRSAYLRLGMRRRSFDAFERPAAFFAPLAPPGRPEREIRRPTPRATTSNEAAASRMKRMKIGPEFPGREAGRAQHACSARRNAQEVSAMSAGAICVRSVHVASLDESVRAVARRMAEGDVGTVVVLGERDRPVGILTDRDLVLRCIAQERDPDTTEVAEVMTAPVTYVYESTPIESALARMAGAHARRLVVSTTTSGSSASWRSTTCSSCSPRNSGPSGSC